MELKDYLHFYLGCECMMTKPSYHAVHELHLSVKERFVLRGKLLAYFIETTTQAEIKPILRPLSDMTNDEWNEMGRKLRTGANIRTARDLWKMNAEETVYLLSKHFDLFGLIDAGLAIDSTKQ